MSTFDRRRVCEALVGMASPTLGRPAYPELSGAMITRWPDRLRIASLATLATRALIDRASPLIPVVQPAPSRQAHFRPEAG